MNKKLLQNVLSLAVFLAGVFVFAPSPAQAHDHVNFLRLRDCETRQQLSSEQYYYDQQFAWRHPVLNAVFNLVNEL